MDDPVETATATTWHPTLPADSVTEGRIHAAQAGEVPVILLRSAGGVVAYRDACPHEKFPFSKNGELEDDVLTCRKHLWQFRIDDGIHISRLQRPHCNLTRYPTRVVGGQVEVGLDG